MKQILDWSGFLRVPNLLIAAFAAYFIRYALVLRAYEDSGLAPYLDGLDYALLVASIVMVTLGGYLINDYYDLDADAINKPDKEGLGSLLHHRHLLWLYLGTQLCGLAIACLLAFKLSYLGYLWLYPAAVGTLWLYSYRMQGVALLGNLLVSAFTAGIPLLIWLSESRVLQELEPIQAKWLGNAMIFYACFAFLANLFREIIKDLEDMEGDQHAGLKTMPIAWGVKTSKYVALACSVLLQGLIWLFIFQYQPDLIGWLFAFLVVILPITTSSAQLMNAEKKEQFSKLSLRAKLFMLGGLLLLLFI